MNTKYRRIMVLGISFCLLAAFLADDVFVLLHAGHDHTGEACHVCAQMKGASDAFRRLLEELLKPAALPCHALLSLSVTLFLLRSFDGVRCETLITKKVRLND